MIFASIILLLLPLATYAQATTRYVSTSGLDSNSCSASTSTSTPKLTIASGIGCMTAGDILYIRGGTYNESINVTQYHIPSGTSWSNAVTIASYPGETATVGLGISIRDNVDASIVSYVIFDRLIVIDPGQGSGTQSGDSPYFIGGNSHHIRLSNSEVTNAATNLIFITDTTTYIEVVNCRVHDAPITAGSDGRTGSSYGFYIYGRHMLIDGNTIYHNTGYGIHHYHSGDSGVSDNIIRNNIVYDNAYNDGERNLSNGGILVTSGSNNQVYNNLIYNNGGVGLSIGAYGGSNYQAYNNTITNNGYIGVTAGGGGVSFGADTVLENNIVFGNNNYQLFDQNPGGTTTNRNVTTDPHFTNVSAHDFTLQADSTAIDAGLTIGAVPTDIVGVTRPQGNGYDIGAYERVAGPPPPPPVGTAVTVYVATTGDDSRSCTTAQNIATPFLTLLKALSCLTAPGSTVYLRAGTYTGIGIETNVNPIASGLDWNTPTRIAGYAQEVVTINISSGGKAFAFQSATNDHYIILDRLIINMQGGDNGLLFYPGVHHIRFQNGEIKNTTYAPIYINSATNIEVLKNLIHDWTAAGTVGVAIVGNSNNILVNGNEIYSAPGMGIVADNGIAPSGTISTITINGNKIHGVGVTDSVAGIRIGGANNLTSTIVNNILYNNYAGLKITTGIDGLLVYNNTFYAQTAQAIVVDSGAVNTQLKNNLMFSNGTTITDNGTGTIVATNRTDNPTFVDAAAGNFNLQATSTAIDTGTTLSIASPDYANKVRPQNASYDVGALEFVGVPEQGGPPGNVPSGGAQRTEMMWMSRGMFHR